IEAKYTEQPIVSFAALDSGHIFVGQIWTGTVYELLASKWQKVYETPQESGGSSVPAMQFDAQGRLWVIGTMGLHVLDKSGWRTLGPFPRAPDIKKNLHGALALQSDPLEVFALGPWGYPVRITSSSSDEWRV